MAYRSRLNWGGLALRSLFVWLLVLLPALAAPLLGYWTLAVSAVLAFFVLRSDPDASARPLVVVAVAVGLIGGAIGIASAALALATVGGLAPYAERAWLGWLALAFAGVAGTGGLLAAIYPAWATLLLAAGALFGTATISLFYINSPYPLAALLWLIAATLALLGRRSNE